MSELNKLKVVDFTAGRLSSDDINTNIPFRDNLAKTRTIQQANAVIGAYVNRNYVDMQNKADKDEIPTKVSELENDEGYITTGDIPSKTSDLINDSGFITKEVNDLTNYLDKTTVEDEFDSIWGDMQDFNGELGDIRTAIDFKTPKRVGNLVVDSIRSKNMLSLANIISGYYSINDGSYGSSATACCTASKIEIDNTKNYVLSTSNTQTTSYMYVMYYNSSGTYLGYISVPFSSGSVQLNTYTNYSNAKYVNFRFDVTKNNLINPMLEEGSEATNYMPYQNLDIQATDVSVVLTGNRIKIGGFSIYSGTIISTFSSGIVNLDVTNLHFAEKPYCVQLTISSSLYSMQYDFDSSSATSLKIKLVSNNVVANVNGNVRYSITIFVKTTD